MGLEPLGGSATPPPDGVYLFPRERCILLRKQFESGFMRDKVRRDIQCAARKKPLGSPPLDQKRRKNKTLDSRVLFFAPLFGSALF